jgi:NAD(P)-dependent dehydrogenase (short-subunit alcohol dehydrogenase family)
VAFVTGGASRLKPRRGRGGKAQHRDHRHRADGDRRRRAIGGGALLEHDVRQSSWTVASAAPWAFGKINVLVNSAGIARPRLHRARVAQALGA